MRRTHGDEIARLVKHNGHSANEEQKRYQMIFVITAKAKMFLKVVRDFLQKNKSTFLVQQNSKVLLFLLRGQIGW